MHGTKGMSGAYLPYMMTLCPPFADAMRVLQQRCMHVPSVTVVNVLRSDSSDKMCGRSHGINRTLLLGFCYSTISGKQDLRTISAQKPKHTYRPYVREHAQVIWRVDCQQNKPSMPINTFPSIFLVGASQTVRIIVIMLPQKC